MNNAIYEYVEMRYGRNKGLPTHTMIETNFCLPAGSVDRNKKIERSSYSYDHVRIPILQSVVAALIQKYPDELKMPRSRSWYKETAYTVPKPSP